MDNKITKIIKSKCRNLFAVTAMDKILNGWFLMKTSQVSTRGVSFLSKIQQLKKQSCCGKVAVGFFSLQAGYLICGFSFELTPSKYMVMKNTLMNTRSDDRRLTFFSIQKDTMKTSYSRNSARR